MKELVAIQGELKAPKNQMNKFGGYKYRSCEDILEAVKPLLSKNNCVLTISDDIIAVSNRVYVQATATIVNAKGEQISVSGYARESESKKGMDDSQVTGSTSSYARKYALNGLFCIDDTKDADATNEHGKSAPQPVQQAPVKVELSAEELKITAKANECKSKEELGNLYKQLLADGKWSNNLAYSFKTIKLSKGWN